VEHKLLHVVGVEMKNPRFAMIDPDDRVIVFRHDCFPGFDDGGE
jgi:hypothetical protein